MALATGSNTRIAYIQEVTPGVTPATPAWNVLGVTTFNLSLSKDTFTSQTIREDRQTAYLRHGNKKITGDLEAELLAVGASPTGNLQFDPLFESALCSAFNTNVLKIANTPKSFTFEKTITDAEGNKTYFRYKGVQVTGFSFDVELNAPVKIKLNLIGMSEDPVATTIVTGATYVAVPSAPLPLIHINAENVFEEGGAANAIMTKFSLTLNNGSDVNYRLGSDTAISITPSRASLTGTATYYYSDATQYNKFVNETSSSLKVKLSDGDRALEFHLPKLTYSSGQQVIQNENTLLVTMNHTAVYDSVNASSLVITRITG
jgi:hypothetical protein